jgi:hypothetical protein
MISSAPALGGDGGWKGRVALQAQGSHRREDGIYMLLSSDHATAFQQALKIGRREESIRMEGRRWVEKRFVEVLQLEGCGIDAKEITAHWETQKPDKALPFSHVFSPEGATPLSVF